MCSKYFQIFWFLIITSSLIIFGCTSDESYDNSGFVSEVNTALQDNSTLSEIPFVIVGGNSGSNYVIISSEDGISWNNLSLNSFDLNAGDGFHDIIYGNGKFAVVGSSGFLMRSIDGSSWSKTIFEGNLTYFSITYGKSKFISVGGTYGNSSNKIIYSNDGQNWQSAGYEGLNLEFGKKVIFCNETFFMMTNEKSFYSSTDGISWSSIDNNLSSSMKNKDFYNYICLNDLIIVLADGSYLAYSSNGIAYTEREISGGGARDITFGKNIYVLAKERALFYNTSLTNTNWSQVYSGAKIFYKVVFRKNLFVAVGETGAIVTSSDGLNWTERISPTADTLRSLY